MNVGLYQGVSAMQAGARRLEAITANLANIDTPAYKRRSPATHAFRLGAAAAENTIRTSYKTDFRQGRLER